MLHHGPRFTYLDRRHFSKDYFQSHPAHCSRELVDWTLDATSSSPSTHAPQWSCRHCFRLTPLFPPNTIPDSPPIHLHHTLNYPAVKTQIAILPYLDVPGIPCCVATYDETGNYPSGLQRGLDSVTSPVGFELEEREVRCFEVLEIDGLV